MILGNSVHSLGIVGEIGAGLQSNLGSELAPVTHILADSRKLSFDRMMQKAREQGVAGLACVTSEMRLFQGNVEFLSTASGLQTAAPAPPGSPMFSTPAGGQELFCQLDSGYTPLQFVFGNVAFSAGSGSSALGALRGLGRGELKLFSEKLTHTRASALNRLVAAARAAAANAVVGIETRLLPFQGVYEMLMTGTAARNPALPAHCSENPVTSDLTSDELWTVTAMGCMPLKLVMATVVYPLGATGGLKSLLKIFTAREVGDVTSLVHEARERVITLLQREAEAVGAETVLGIRTHLKEMANIVEFTAVGTAIKRLPGMSNHSSALPSQAFTRNRETWTQADDLMPQAPAPVVEEEPAERGPRRS